MPTRAASAYAAIDDGLIVDRDALGRVHAAVEASAVRGGLSVFAGPTGSGKNRLAYHLLRRAASVGLSAASVEVAPRAALEGVAQAVVPGFFDGDGELAVCGAVVRQPGLDVCYVRELLTFDVAALVLAEAVRRRTRFFATLHTNDAAQIVARLLAMGCEPWQVAGALRLVQAQRVLRRLCPACRAPAPTPASVFRDAALAPAPRVYRPAGCARCDETGYRGEVLVAQQVTVDDEVARQIAERARLRPSGPIPTLRQAALQAVSDGETTVEEALLGTPP